jgi:hypothetical protein
MNLGPNIFRDFPSICEDYEILVDKDVQGQDESCLISFYKYFPIKVEILMTQFSQSVSIRTLSTHKMYYRQFQNFYLKNIIINKKYYWLK